MKHKKDYKDIQKYKKGIFTKYCIKVRGKSLRCPTSQGNHSVMVVLKTPFHKQLSNDIKETTLLPRIDIKKEFIKTKEQQIRCSNWKLLKTINKKK